MKRGDCLLGTFGGDTNSPPTLYLADIQLVDSVDGTADLFFPDFGMVIRADFTPGAGVSWPATGDDGKPYDIATHTVYTPTDVSPGQGDVALLTLSGGLQEWCFVETITETVNVQLYKQPYSRLCLGTDEVTASDSPDYPVGVPLVSLQRAAADDSVPTQEAFGVFSDGWWSEAIRRDAHPGRVGPVIQPFAVVIHTTDMPPGSLPGLINRWTSQPGEGNGSHFVIGRSAAEGFYQLVPIDRNGNHAGGPGHGSFTDGSHTWHPNSVSVGIELHCAGQVRMHEGQWRLFSEGAPSGPPIPVGEVIPNPNNPQRGWQIVTPYQYEQLAALLDGLEATIGDLPAGCVATSIAPVPAYGQFPTGRIVGHVSLDADSRGDPWPATCDWIRAR